MIDTIMALWNRGKGGRGLVALLAFVLFCICISLLLVTTVSAWSALLHGKHQHTAAAQRTGISYQTPTGTQSGHTGISTPPQTPTQTPTPPVCSVSPTMGVSHATTPTTIVRGHKQGPYNHPTPVPTRSKPTPGPTPPKTPTPTKGNNPTPTPSPTSVPTSTPTSTPTMTTTPGGTTSNTPVPSPTETPTAGSTASPTVDPSATRGTSTVGGQPLMPGGGRAGPGSSSSNNCLGDSLNDSAYAAALAALEEYAWLVVGGALTATIIFCGALYRLSLRRHPGKSA